MHCGVPTLSHSFLAPVPLKLDLVWLPGGLREAPTERAAGAQLQGLPSRNAETGDPKLTLPGSQSVARRREERILTLASLSFKPSPGWGPGAQTHADPAVKATAAFPSLTRPDSQTGARRRDEETPHPRPFILQAVARGGARGDNQTRIRREETSAAFPSRDRGKVCSQCKTCCFGVTSVRREFTAAR
ncbi:hypothetical protein NDU88_005314 [Pleurodeles waltl]|uniref:Uncharacterized protein n=1 Tax=Pleurodeles waltl TaxID=8319 RepID=A0AAV7QKT7_PLEWA|nr:hypothetical protein NDU88_005314 [Pleurodeles waltl]